MENVPSPAATQPELTALQEQCAQLRQWVTSLLLILIVISGTLSIFLLRQWRFARSELNNIPPAALQMISEYNTSRPGIEDFLRKLADYSRTHPDFAPIAGRYHLNEYLPKPGAVPVTSSLPANPSPK